MDAFFHYFTWISQALSTEQTLMFLLPFGTYRGTVNVPANLHQPIPKILKSDNFLIDHWY